MGGFDGAMNTSKPQTRHEEPKPQASEDSVPQDDGTDNEWQMEPFKEDEASKPA